VAVVRAFLIGVLLAAAVLALVAVLAGVKWPQPSALRRPVPPGRLAIALACGVAALMFTGIPVAMILGGALGWWVPGMVSARRARHGLLARKDAITAWARQLSDVMAGSVPVIAIKASVDTAPHLIAAEVRRFSEDLERMPFAAAAHVFAQRLGDADGEIVAAALIVAYSSGGAAAKVLVELAQSAEDNAAMWRRVDAARAGLDVRARIITGIFVAAFIGARLVSPGLLAPYHSAVGQMVLAATSAMFAVSYLWLGKMRRAALPDTILVRPEVAA
jgi:tight adherence protein B